MLLFYLPAVLFVCYYGLLYYFTRTFNYWQKRNILGPKPVAFFGNLKELTLRQKNVAVIFKEMYNMFPNEKVIGIYRMTTPCLLIRDLDIIKQIMIKDFHIFQDRGIDFSKKGLGQNLFHADGDTWSALRARFTPIFTTGKLKNMFYLLNDRADILMKHITYNVSRKNLEFDIRSLVQKYTVSTIFACAFGLDYDGFQSDLHDSLKALEKMIFTPNYATDLDFMYPGLLKKFDLSIFPAGVKTFFDELVATIISQRNGKPSSRGDFMDLILQLREMGTIDNIKNNPDGNNKCVEISDDIIAAQAFVFYIAGYETSATTLSYLLYELALNPEIQDKLREEIDSIMEAHAAVRGEITYDSLKDMKYLEKVFSETLRLYPILDPLQRKALTDYKIPGTDVVIEKDQIVLIPVTGKHYDEKYFPNPEVFDPERFDPELVRVRHSCSYLPFGVGPRNCIGMRFGTLQSRLCIAKIISNFRVEANENTKTPLGINPYKTITAPKENIFLNMRAMSQESFKL